ncbi:hypothetical protein [Oryza sativa Japonica Group]|uniref:DUF834 domain-containing protein n=1 Tax=Oryza sativa subsp. japonica TaxID=39947 RepID=Q5ZCM7_ORYSJ|nr:hypothetical protein [Oryza sativa Japonica Group]
MAHPGSTATTGTATEAERGGGAARVDEDGGVPVVGGRNEGVDEVGEDAAKPKEAMPKREEPHGSRWNACTGGADRGRPDPTSAELAPTWRLRGCHVGWREEDEGPAANGRRAAAVSPGRLATMRGDGAYTGTTRKKERERANGLDSPEGVCRRRISAAATGGEQRGKRRRGHEGPIPGGESIYAATGIRC